MNIMDIMLFFLGLWAFYAYFSRQRVVFRAEHLSVLHRPGQMITIRIEEEPGQVYLWNHESDEFLAQGKDLEEALNRCVERFPTTQFKVLKQDNEVAQK